MHPPDPDRPADIPASPLAPPGPTRVLSVVSNKGGVGKTTIATNLAIQLRASDEGLPVLLIGLDDQSLIDRMFAIDPVLPKRTIADALLTNDLRAAIRPGRHGVHYVPSPVDASDLQAHVQDTNHLRRLIDGAWTGLVIIDTKSDLGPLTRNAIAASDLTVAPVKDHQSLLEADKLFDLLLSMGRPPTSARVLLSLIDLRVKFTAGETRDILGLLVEAIRSRGYPLFETFISRSPKVEALLTNTEGRALSVLHDAPGSLIAEQMRHLASDVARLLEEREGNAERASRGADEGWRSPAAPDTFDPGPRTTALARETSIRQRLKQRVAVDPAGTLGEAGLETVAVDCACDLGDTVDVVLRDALGRIASVQIGVGIEEGDRMTIAQAIKSRAMVELKWGLEHASSRALLVSDSIPPQTSSIAREYDVQCISIGAV